VTGLYLGCLAGGVLFAIAAGLLGDVISEWLDGVLDFMSVDYLKPVVLAAAVTGFGGAGWLLEKYTPIMSWLILILSVCIAFVIAVLTYFIFVKPMQNSENSVSFSLQELEGKIAEVTVPVPSQGFGEVLLRVGASNTSQIAASHEGESIEAGARVVVVQVRDGTLYVSRLNSMEERG
jgi:membrane protein implicated in regulation of membrane protease activity